MATPSIYLASNSPRRRELLTQIGVCFEQHGVDIDETPRQHEPPERYVLRMAQEKALAAQSQLQQQATLPVLCADTTVVAAGAILGKPSSRDEAVAMLRRLSASDHQVLTAVAVADGERVATRLSRTRVWFSPISEEQALRYWASGEAADKAGGYGIQGRGAAFVERIEGSYSGVVGLPLAETVELLTQFEVPYWVY
ncbi:Maf family protein [Aestuariirhabdus sp. LZHN29]|uniref:Maf family protein n=1 Tax=Aestuariirhabdus sp. LZHN29 TaxID=3417462 RepID=UPI003CFA28A7